MHAAAIAQALFLVFVANGAPLLAKRMLGRRGAFPIDFNQQFPDGAPVLGASKTIRGVVVSLIATTLAAVLIGLPWSVGTLAAAAAMAGDSLSSFVKRRLKLPSQGMAPGIDQWPESLFPLLALKSPLGLGVADVALAVLLFWIGALILSRALFSLKIRERPY